MELKPQNYLSFISSDRLLIVPYGIETTCFVLIRTSSIWLLIVPYGIETFCRFYSYWIRDAFNCTLWNWNLKERTMAVDELQTFNCTLWNWNKHIGHLIPNRYSAFNCTLWNWNRLVVNFQQLKRSFNCTLWNWNWIFRWFPYSDSRF